MKAFLLSAGHGTRLRPITDSIPKCLVPIRGVPLLEIWLDLCGRHGIDEVLVNVHAHQQKVEHFLQDVNTDVKVIVSQEEVLLGSAGTLRAHRRWVENDEYFWIFYADVLNAMDLSRMAKYHEAKGMAATIGVYTVPDPSRCGIVTADADGIVRDFVEKPERPLSNLAFSGIMIATPQLLADIPVTDPADIGFHVLPRLIGRTVAYRIEEYLIDVGTMENYLTAQNTWPGETPQSNAFSIPSS